MHESEWVSPLKPLHSAYLIAVADKHPTFLEFFACLASPNGKADDGGNLRPKHMYETSYK